MLIMVSAFDDQCGDAEALDGQEIASATPAGIRTTKTTPS